MLIQITAPHFCAGLVLGTNLPSNQCAPIISYMRHWTLKQIVDYCKKKKWEIEALDNQIEILAMMH